MKKKIKYLLRAVIFVVLLTFLFNSVSTVMSSTGDYRNYQWVAGFYEEPENSLDGVYIGSSNCYAFWNSMTAWEEHGIAVWPYACNAMMFEATEYVIKDCRKTQPDAVYIVNTNTIPSTEIKPSRIHWLADYMPFSVNKMNMIKHLTDTCNFTDEEKIEFYFPMYLYHNRWSDLKDKDFNYELDGYKGSCFYDTYLYKAKNVKKVYFTSDKANTLTYEMQSTIDSLLNYCTEENVKIMFVTVPRWERKEENLLTINAANNYIREKGFTVLDFNNAYDELKIDLTQDYYGKTHTNIHGSIKFTNYLSEYLIENYNFTNKRNDDTYKSWNEGWEEYNKTISNAVLDFELENPEFDTSLKKPKNITVVQNEKDVDVQWKKVKGAKTYSVYRKDGEEGSWTYLSDVQDTKFTDTNCIKDNLYKYRIVPYYEKDGEKIYGFFNLKGAEITIE